MDRFIITIIIAFAINPTFISTKPLFWFRTTTTTASTTTSNSSSNSDSTGTNSSTYNFDNGNSVSAPINFVQTGSNVDKSSVTTLDQYVGDLNITIPTGRRKRSIRTIFSSDASNYTSEIQNCINQYPFDYQSSLNNAVSSVISCISGDSFRSLSVNDQALIRNFIERSIIARTNDGKIIFSVGQSNIAQCATEASDQFAQDLLEAAQNINDCIAYGTSTTSTTTTTTAATTTTTVAAKI